MTDAPAQHPEESENKGLSSQQRTPFWEAMHAPRYERQVLINQIQSVTGRRLICYVGGWSADIERDDVLGFADLLRNIPPGTDIDYLLHTPGGDMDAAEKITSMVRERVGEGMLRIVVPDCAKSAGTLMVLGSDVVLMSDTSELGSIDPQIIRQDSDGNRIRHSVLDYLDAYKEHSQKLRETPHDVPAQIMLGKLNPETVKFFEIAKRRARELAEGLLRNSMLKGREDDAPVTRVGAALVEREVWPTHGQMINWREARAMGLVVEYLAQDDPLWCMWWSLYCRQRLALEEPKERLFESDHVFVKLRGR
jgi:hypothetical protein